MTLRSILISILFLLSGFVTQLRAESDSLSYLRIQKSHSKKFVRIYYNDSIELKWSEAWVRGSISSINDSVIFVDGIGYDIESISTIKVPKSSWGRSLLSAVPKKMIQFGFLVSIYGQINHFVIERRWISDRWFNTKPFVFSAITAGTIEGLMRLTAYRTFHTDRSTIKVVTF